MTNERIFLFFKAVMIPEATSSGMRNEIKCCKKNGTKLSVNPFSI